MSALEIVLLIAGAIIFIVSFILPVNREEVSEGTRELAQDEIRRLVAQEMNDVKGHMDDVVDEAVENAMEKTERSLEKLSNEKIMAVSDYSDTVLQGIHKNHEEVMFLYDMLNDKHTSLKNAVSQVNETVSQVNETVRNVKESRRDAEAAVSSWKQIQLETMDKQQKDAGIMRITRMKEEAAEARRLAAMQEAKRLAAEQEAKRLAAELAARQEALERVRQAEIEERARQAGLFEQMQRVEEPELQREPELPRELELPGESEFPGEPKLPEEPKLPKEPELLVKPGKFRSKKSASKSSAKKAVEPEFSPQETVPEPVPEPEVSEESLNSNDRILARYKQGKSTVAIAKELGLGVGEVKLVIDLYKNHA